MPSRAKIDQFYCYIHPLSRRKASIRMGLSHHLPSLMWPATYASSCTIRMRTATLNLSVRTAYISWQQSISNRTCTMQNSFTFAPPKLFAGYGVLGTLLNRFKHGTKLTGCPLNGSILKLLRSSTLHLDRSVAVVVPFSLDKVCFASAPHGQETVHAD